MIRIDSVQELNSLSRVFKLFELFLQDENSGIQLYLTVLYKNSQSYTVKFSFRIFSLDLDLIP